MTKRQILETALAVIDAKSVGLSTRCGVVYTQALKAVEKSTPQLITALIQLALVAGALDACAEKLPVTQLTEEEAAAVAPPRDGEVPF